MKKFFSCFLASLICVFSGLGVVLAGGVNKTEVLSDGTVLRYVSSDKIPELVQEYDKLAQEISENKLSNTQNIGIRTVSGVLGVLGYVFSSNIFTDPAWVLGGKIVSLVSGVIGFLYPDYHEYKTNQKLINNYKTEDAKQYIRMHEFSNIRGQLWAFCREREYDSDYLKQEYESGLVIILRPAYKQKYINKNNGTDCRYFPSGIQSQRAMQEEVLDWLTNSIKMGC